VKTLSIWVPDPIQVGWASPGMPPPGFFPLEIIRMKTTVRLLITDKKGIHRRIEAAVQGGGGKIQSTRLKRQMRGMSEAEIDITYESTLCFSSIMSSLGRVPVVALLGTPSPIPPSPPTAQS